MTEIASAEIADGIDFESTTADAWEEILENHDVELIIHATDGSHYFEWDDYTDDLSFMAYGSQGYDYDGSRAALEEISEQSDGLRLVEKGTYDRVARESRAEAES